MEYIVLGDNDVAVPSEFFKAVAVFYDDGAGNEEVRFHGWIMENRSDIPDAPLQSFQKSKDDISSSSGLILFQDTKFSYENDLLCQGDSPK